jgi:hypothetical protein
MDLEKLEKLAKLVLKELPTGYNFRFEYNPHVATEFMNLMVVAQNSLPEYK